MSHAPYGPNSGSVRQFLVQLAGLGADDRARVVSAYHRAVRDTAWDRAERQIADALVRSDREAHRDALSGPLLQLVRRKDAPPPTTDEDALAALDPIAEPALAAVLALLVQDLVSHVTRETLLGPFAGVMAPHPTAGE
jgi:hypothetical protein